MKKSTIIITSVLLLASSTVFAQTAATKTAAECDAIFATADVNTDGMIDGMEMKTMDAGMLSMMMPAVPGTTGSDTTATGTPTTENPNANAATAPAAGEMTKEAPATSGSAAAEPAPSTTDSDTTATGTPTPENPDANAATGQATATMTKEAFLAACTKA